MRLNRFVFDFAGCLGWRLQAAETVTFRRVVALCQKLYHVLWILISEERTEFRLSLNVMYIYFSSLCDQFFLNWVKMLLFLTLQFF